MISCDINQNRVMPSSICADIFEGDEFAEWTSLVDARVIGKVNGMDGIQYSVVRFLPRSEVLTDVVNTPAGTWMLDPHEIRYFSLVHQRRSMRVDSNVFCEKIYLDFLTCKQRVRVIKISVSVV